MPIDITMPALSPTMESGTLAKWHIKVGDEVKSGQVIAEIETDKATMDVEAVDEGKVLELLVPEGAEEVKVNAVIARLAGEGEDASAPPAKAAPASEPAKAAPTPEPAKTAEPAPAAPAAPAPQPAAVPTVAATAASGDRIIATPLAKRIARQNGVDLAAVKGTGPHGRIVRADVEAAAAGGKAAAAPQQAAAAPAPQPIPVAAPAAKAAGLPESDVPHADVKLSNMRKTIARRLTESKQTVPHYYLAVDVRLDALLKLRGQLNASLEKQGVKLSVNDMLVKALGLALLKVPDANASFGGDIVRRYSRADESVAVAIPGGLITPVIRDAGNKRLSQIATEMKDRAGRAKEGKLQPPEYSGGTASLSNLGMFGIKQFEAVINPPEGMIMAVGVGEQRPYVVDGALAIATVMTATGSFDHRVIDGAVGAELMAAFKALVEDPMAMLA